MLYTFIMCIQKKKEEELVFKDRLVEVLGKSKNGPARWLSS